MRISANVKPNQNIDIYEAIDNNVVFGEYGINFSFISKNIEGEEIYSRDLGAVLTSNNFTCNPFLIKSEETGVEVSAVIDISKISNIFNYIKLSPFMTDFEKFDDKYFIFSNIKIEMGYDINDLNDSTLILGVEKIENDDDYYTNSLHYSTMETLNRQLKLTYV